jgi:hypothetical protein
MGTLSSVQHSNKSPKQSQFKKPEFSDDLWNDVFYFMQNYFQPKEVSVLPDEFCNFFSNSYSYYQAQLENFEQFDWVLLHKGRLSDLTLNFLNYVCRSLKPVLANEVFVLFSRSQAVSEIHRKHLHLYSLLVDVKRLKFQEISNRVPNIKAILEHKALNRVQAQKAQALIEGKRYASWFTSKQDAAVPLAWVSTSPRHSFVNLGDALSPVIVSALSGLPIVHCDFESQKRRLACVGTIGHGFKNGVVHFWGTGIDPLKNPIDSNLGYYQKPPKTKFCVHALRGRFSAQILRNQEIQVPTVYGDPVWFLPSIIPPTPKKQYELGVIVHLSELTELTDTAGIKETLLRYKLPPSLSDSIRIITTITQPNFTALKQKVQEITSCKRIVSTSLHGLVIAETYDIPCVWFRNFGKGAAFTQLDEDSEHVDWRVRDYYSGVGMSKLFVYGQRRSRPTDWEDLIRAIDTYWQPVQWSPEPFLDAFPLPLTFNPLQDGMFTHRSLFQQIQF